MEPFQLPCVQSISSLYHAGVSVEVLRLDQVHPVVSGNKWYKLKEYLSDAISLHKKTILSFGGAWSNHIIATAAACQMHGLQSIGIIRGEKPATLSATLRHAMAYGMELFFVSRQDYRQKVIPPEIFIQHQPQDIYVVNEGGYGALGAKGAQTICDLTGSDHTHVIAAAGTGTTLAGLINGASDHLSVTGISVLKNNLSLEKEIRALLKDEGRQFDLLHHFHFGGYAKYNKQLTDFMNAWYEKTGIPTDFVYTAKLFFAANELLGQGQIPDGSRVLIIHSGGLQGNESLPKGTLIF